MSLIHEYMSERRKKKLEEVTKALEQLKHENVATDALKPKSTLSTSASHLPMRTGKDLLFIGILLVCVVVLVITSFYYRTQYSKLDIDYQEKVSRLATLDADLQENIDDLEAAQEKLDDLKASEKDVLRERDRLEAEIEDLEDEISAKQDELDALEIEVTNLTRTVTNQQRDIIYWRNCIEDELNENLSVCD
ncbi:MAG TPA: hypothetical protein VJH37_01565 [Candidatus Nanoarchaeia archaeon]|nr:hypothetical protein [Candidatus Nanoarchaeia archaeon]